MLKFGKKVVKYRIPIFIISLLLLVPSLFGYINTRVNYDILYYLPDSIETMQGQDILADQFGTGAYSLFVCEGMSTEQLTKTKDDIEDIEHVDKVIWYSSLLDSSIPMDILPDNIYDAFNAEDSTLMFIIFDTTTSADETMDAIHEIRQIAGKNCFVAGMSAIVTDTKDLSEDEVPIYVLIAVVLSAIVLSLTMNSFVIPFIFLASIGMAILYNMGSNYFMGQISYVTKALSAVLQLGVTMDYSIFLWHSYQEEIENYRDDHHEAMAHAIASTLKSVVGSSITTVAGFVALCFMTFTLGLDLGIVMAKGVVFGVICCVTVLPSMILVFDKVLMKTRHKELLPDTPKLSEFLVKHYKVIAIIFVLLIFPAAYLQSKTDVYYNLDTSLPADLDSSQANTKLKDNFNMGAVHMLLIDSSMETKDVSNMIDEIEEIKGIKSVLGLEALLGPEIPDEFIPDTIKETLENENYELLVVLNKYQTATDEVNEQIDKMDKIVKRYDPNGMVVGEAPCTKDLIEITDHDFKVVSAVSILTVFAIILFVFGSISLPVILVAVIEFAIYVNLGIPYVTGTVLPFIASIVIGTIQLGATVDYAILMTSRYEKERCLGNSKKDSILTAHKASVKSILVSALSFFAATFGVGVYSKIDMISSLCVLMSRGALISMVVVIFILPSMFLVFDGLICKTSRHFRKALKASK